MIGNLFRCVLPVTLLSIFFLPNSACIAQTPKPLSPDLIQHLNQDKFVEIHSATEIPDGVKAHYLKIAGVHDISKVFANPGHDLSSRLQSKCQMDLHPGDSSWEQSRSFSACSTMKPAGLHWLKLSSLQAKQCRERTRLVKFNVSRASKDIGAAIESM